MGDLSLRHPTGSMPPGPAPESDDGNPGAPPGNVGRTQDQERRRTTRSSYVQRWRRNRGAPAGAMAVMKALAAEVTKNSGAAAGAGCRQDSSRQVASRKRRRGRTCRKTLERRSVRAQGRAIGREKFRTARIFRTDEFPEGIVQGDGSLPRPVVEDNKHDQNVQVHTPR